MIKAIGRLSGFVALVGILTGGLVSSAKAAVCVSRTGTLAFRPVCRPLERTIGPDELGIATEGTLPPAYAGYNDGSYLPLLGYETPAFDLAIPEAGSYLITAKVNAINTGGNDRVSCRLYANYFRDQSVAQLPAGAEHTISFTLTDTFYAPGQIRLSCWGDGWQTYISWIKINAVKVDSISNDHLTVNPDHTPPIP